MKSVEQKMKHLVGHQSLVSKKEYRTQAMATTVRILEAANYKYTRVLGEGTFGSVVELQYAPLQATFAANIVLVGVRIGGRSTLLAVVEA